MYGKRLKSVRIVGVVLLSLMVVLSSLPVTATWGTHTTATTDIETYETTMEIKLEENGDARWSVVNEIKLSSETERKAFDRLATNHTKLRRIATDTVEGFRKLAEKASDRTDREMEIRYLGVDPERKNDTGRIAIGFEWTNFAESSNESDLLVVGDVFGDGFSLEEDQTMSIKGPQEYEVTDVNSEIVDTSEPVSFKGPIQIDDGISLVFENPESDQDSKSQNEENTDQGDSTSSEENRGSQDSESSSEDVTGSQDTESDTRNDASSAQSTPGFSVVTGLIGLTGLTLAIYSRRKR